MKKFLALTLALAMVFTLCACGSSSPAASAKKTYTIGICQLLQHQALDLATEGFMAAVTDALGAENVSFDVQNAQGESGTCATIVTGFVANKVDLIMANATPAVQAAINATTEIPILGTSVTDFGEAMKAEIDATVGTGINLSGTSDGVNAQVYVDVIKELIPDAQKISVVYCNAEANSKFQADAFQVAMEAAGATVSVYTFSDSNDMQSVVTMAVADCDALYIPTDNTAADNMTIVSNVCTAAKVPVICGEENMCSKGGLATASIDYYDIGYVCGQMAVDVLVNGADVSKMPIGYAANPMKKYNADFAAAIGFEMPEGYEAIG